MNVLLVNKLYYPVIGGVETVVRDLARHLPREVARKVLVASETGTPKTEIIDNVEVVKVRSLGTISSNPVAPSFPFALRRLAHWADVLHFHFPFPTGELSYLLSGVRKPLVVTYHSDIVRQKGLLAMYRPFLERFLDRADVILATSPNYIDTSPYLAPRREKCLVVPIGIDTSLYEETPARKERARSFRESFPRDLPLVLFVGRLIYYKGVEYLVRAMKDVDANLAIVGSGPLEEEIRSLIDELGIADRVRLFPPLSFDDLVSMYHACDVFCLPSVERSEAFGIVLLEAQACGKPCVSTELGTGTSYANLDGVTGLVVPPRNPEALARALNALLSNDSWRSRLGSRARERVNSEFEVRTTAALVCNAYEFLRGSL